MLFRKSQERIGPRWRPHRRHLSWALGLAFVMMVASGLAALLIVPRAYSWAKPRLAYYRWSPEAVESGHVPTLLRSTAATATNWLSATLRGPEVESLYIDVRWKHMDELRRMRGEALDQGLLTEEQRAFVPATIRHRDRVLRVKLRLKGDLTDHLKGKSWSYRVHVRDGGQLLGLRRFSIQHPSTRAYETEPLYLDHLRRFDVLAPRYAFARVTVNGDPMGVMALEEHFSKELVESQQRRGGVIVAFDENDYWVNQLAHGSAGPYDSYLVQPIRVFREGWIEKTPELVRDAEIARGLLRRFTWGELPASQVFDVGVLARYLAVSELWGAYHAIRWHNLRFYYNPLTTRLEPIGFDRSMVLRDYGAEPVAELEPIAMRMLADPPVREAYWKALTEVASDYLESAEPELRSQAAAHLRVLHLDSPYLMPLPLGHLARRAERLLAVQELHDRSNPSRVLPAGQAYPRPVLAEYEARDGKLHFVLANRIPEAVRVTGIAVLGEDGQRRELPLPHEIVLPPTPGFARPQPSELFLPGSEPALPGTSLELTARVAGRGEEHRIPLQAMPRARAEPPLRLPAAETLPVLLARNGFLEREGTGEQLAARAGTWQVSGSLVLPEGWALRIPAGTTLRFAAGEGLILAGPLDLEGTPEAPVILEPADAEAGWSGVALLESDRPSGWSHAIVRGTRGFAREGWTPTGAVMLRRSEVALRSCRFEGSEAEDGLNLVRGRFALDDVVFERMRSDALDADFAEVRITGGAYREIGGDAVDVSGSRASLAGTSFRNVHDKAVSVGESSELDASDLDVAEVGTGVVSKDRSRTRVVASRFTGIGNAALMAYVKKPEYGPAELHAEDVRLTGGGRMAIAQRESRLTIDGQEIPAEDLDVERLYAGAMRK